MHHTATHTHTTSTPRPTPSSALIYNRLHIDCNRLQQTAQTAQTATHCNRLKVQHTATHCNTIKSYTSHCNTQIYHINTKTRTIRSPDTWQTATATHCNTMFQYATHYNTLATHCNTLQHTNTTFLAPMHDRLHQTTPDCNWNTLQHTETISNSLQHPCNTLQHTTTHTRTTSPPRPEPFPPPHGPAKWMNHIAHINKSCHTYGWVMLHIGW